MVTLIAVGLVVGGLGLLAFLGTAAARDEDAAGSALTAASVLGSFAGHLLSALI